MVAAFWSPNHGQTGTTTSALTLASMVALTGQYTVLLTHSHLGQSTLERCMMPRKPGGNDTDQRVMDNGMDALRRLARNGRLMPEKISDYTTPLLADNQLDLLRGTQSGMAFQEEEEACLFQEVFKGAKEAYDLLIVDVHSGTGQQLTPMLLDGADLVVVCLNQNRWLMDDFFSNDDYKDVLNNKKVIYHIAAYDDNSKYTLKNIKRLYGLEMIIGTPYSPDLRDACNNGLALDFLMRHHEVQRKDRYYPLMKQIRQSTQVFLDTLKMMEAV